jgi:hypothetical protein
MRFQSWIIALLILLGVVPLASAAECNAPTSGAPYAVSTERCLTAMPATIELHGDGGGTSGSDQWVMTWTSDNTIYAMWGDGQGWSLSSTYSYLGGTRITNSPPGLSGSDVFTANDANRKPRALVGDASSVMRGFFDRESDGWNGSWPMSSTNNGTSWSYGGSATFTESTDHAKVVGIAQAGAGHTGLPAGVDASYYYVYLGCPLGGGCNDFTHLYLGRVPKASWNIKAAYTWYSGLDGSNHPTWTSTYANKVAVFTDTNGMGYHVGVSYFPAAGRWLMARPHSTAGCTTNEPCRLGVFEGETRGDRGRPCTNQWC